MAKKKTNGAGQKRRMEVVGDETKVITFYANNANVEVSNWDVKIRLGIIKGATADAIAVQDTAHVYMSHSHFRAFVNAMNDLITRMDSKQLMGHTGKPIVPSLE
jgi:hypothetical protein